MDDTEIDDDSEDYVDAETICEEIEEGKSTLDEKVLAYVNWLNNAPNKTKEEQDIYYDVLYHLETNVVDGNYSYACLVNLGIEAGKGLKE